MANAKDMLMRNVTGLHKAVFRASKGRLLGRGMGMPVLILTTTGAKSGKQRESMLTSPLIDGDRVMLVASYGGDDRHPAWFHNLRAHPDVEVTMDGRARAMRAKVASPEERADLWPRITTAHKNYAGYQRKTDREIPVVILEPSGKE